MQILLLIRVPQTILKLSDYLARKQYGEVAPLVFGRYYVDQPTSIKTESEKMLNKINTMNRKQDSNWSNDKFFQECTVANHKTISTDINLGLLIIQLIYVFQTIKILFQISDWLVVHAILYVEFCW